MPPPARRRRPLPVRTRGTGSVFQEGEQGFRAQVRLSTVDHPEGETLRHRSQSYEGAQQWLDEQVRQRLGSGVLSRADREVSVSAYGAQWLERKRPALSPKTYAIYENSLRLWIGPSIGELKIVNVRRADIRRFVDYIGTHPGARKGQNLSFATQQIQWRTLRTILRSAVADGIVNRHWLHPEDAPVRPYGEVVSNVRDRAIPDHLLGMIISRLMTPEWECSADNHAAGRCRAGWVLRIATGIRQGEYLALQSQDVVLQPKTTAAGAQVYVGILRLWRHAERRPFQHGCPDNSPCGHRWGADCPQRKSGGMVAVPGLKSHRDDERRLHIPGDLGLMLHQHKAAMSAGPRAWLFGDAHKMLTPEQDTRRWKTLLAASYVDAPFRIHDLRHTALTNIANTVSLVHAQAIAGHSDPQTTRRYVHPSVEWTVTGLEESVALLGELGRQPLLLLDEEEGVLL